MIDFVVTWVDGSDKQWQDLRKRYSPIVTNQEEAQYRDWNIFKYWFRAIEKYADWVGTIHLVTCGQVPEWLNTEHKKIKIVNHVDFIPAEYLPTFSSHTIELNLHRISGLSEKFVYFNDDMYLASPTEESVFFKNGLPCHTPIMSAITPSVPSDPFVHYLCNDLSVINAHFNKRQVLKNNITKWFNVTYGKMNFKNLYYCLSGGFTGFVNYHLPSSMMKSDFEEVWQKEYKLLDATCRNRFRGLGDVNQYVINYYNICTGRFHPRSPKNGVFLTIGPDTQKIENVFKSQKYPMVCINDNPYEINFQAEKEKIIKVMDEVFPEKSAFEI